MGNKESGQGPFWSSQEGASRGWLTPVGLTKGQGCARKRDCPSHLPPPALPRRSSHFRLSTSPMSPTRGVKGLEATPAWKPNQRQRPRSSPQSPTGARRCGDQFTARGTVRDDTDTFVDLQPWDPH